MKMRCVLALLVAAAVGCTSDDPAPTSPDASASMMAGGPCTGAAYDPCTTNDQCTSNNCHYYQQSNFTVCTQTCTYGDDTTCPVDSSGNHGTCNKMGLCKPAAANSCTR